MSDKKFDIVNPQHSELTDRIVDDIKRGVSRRDVMRTLLAGGMLASTAGGLLTHAGTAFAQTPKKGGKIRVAVGAGSTADTLDPAKGGNIADYVRHFMFYNCLTTIDTKLTPQMALAESVSTKDGALWTIKLRKDVRFHDGKPLTSADVVYSLTAPQESCHRIQSQGGGRRVRGNQGDRPERTPDQAEFSEC